MGLQGETKIYCSGGRHSVYIPAGLIHDSAFPFTSKDKLLVRVDGERIVIEKAPSGAKPLARKPYT